MKKNEIKKLHVQECVNSGKHSLWSNVFEKHWIFFFFYLSGPFRAFPIFSSSNIL